MPTYEILIDGKPRKIELTKNGETYTAKLNDETLKIELEIPKPQPEKETTITVEGRKYRITLPKIETTKPFPIKIEQATFTAQLTQPYTKKATTTFQPTFTAPTKPSTITNKQTVQGAVTAPMTGKIISVKVKKGEQVKPKQVLCIIEAMKMENEITAPKPGTIQQINITEGTSVTEGETLFVIA
jgi:biotin carboxyl carrier protein